MGHPIHKHMSGRAYDAKEAYNKDLSDSARLHYLENDEHDKGMSRYSVEKGPHAKHGDAPHRNSSPANNITYGDKSGPTGYIGEQKADLMKYNAVDDKAGMSRMVSPLNSEGGIDKHGHIMGKTSKRSSASWR